MTSQEAERIHRDAVIVEGHRDLFEMVRLADQGQRLPLLNVTLPRLKRANISTTFYSIAGDSVTHSRGTRQFLRSALESIDMLRQEIAASRGRIKLILHADDLPAAPSPDALNVVMSFEGGRPLEGRIENLRKTRTICRPSPSAWCGVDFAPTTSPRCWAETFCGCWPRC